MIKIISTIYSILSNSHGVTDIVEDKIFPDVVPDTDGEDEIKFPILVCTRSGLQPTYSKGCVIDEASVDITCWGNSYEEAVVLADEVRTALEFYKGDGDGFEIRTIRLNGAAEGYTQPAFFQELSFSVR